VIERKVRAATAGAGCAPYRSHTAFMDLIADQYDANDSALRRTVERIKDALDPAGTLAPASRASGRPAGLTAPTWRPHSAHRRAVSGHQQSFIINAVCAGQRHNWL